jgi:diaminohydroxyphosphoribosylaminopyrimidine deaminase/5-amino-6-(5-phosphoribosylamino)uracil reductase
VNDLFYMKLALKLAARGAGWVSPNPMVGAVVVQDGQMVGKGYHRRAGAPHAEVEALRKAGDAARGAELYVTLEPCNHQGRTPPCTRAILDAGVRRVIVATRDPNPQVRGGGAEFLASHGVKVEVGLLESKARRLNEAWFKWVETGLPWVMAKAACSLDGRIATYTGESQWLTGEAARAFAHKIRHRADAILVGLGTILADNPQLTTRLGGRKKMIGGGGKGRQAHLQSSPNPPPPIPQGSGKAGPGAVPSPDALVAQASRLCSPDPFLESYPRRSGKDPIRVVLDSRLRLPLTARVLHLASPAPTWVATTGEGAKDRGKVKALKDLGAEVLVLPEDSGRVALKPLLGLLGRRQVQSLLVEGGAETLGSFFDRRLVDQFYFFYAPKILGGKTAPGILAGQGVAHLKDALQARDLTIRRMRGDLLIYGYLEY